MVYFFYIKLWHIKINMKTGATKLGKPFAKLEQVWRPFSQMFFKVWLEIMQLACDVAKNESFFFDFSYYYFFFFEMPVSHSLKPPWTDQSNQLHSSWVSLVSQFLALSCRPWPSVHYRFNARRSICCMPQVIWMKIYT